MTTIKMYLFLFIVSLTVPSFIMAEEKQFNFVSDVLGIKRSVSYSTLNVSTEKKIGRASQSLYGVNMFAGWSVELATNQAYQKMIRSLGCHTVRFHSAAMYKSNAWNFGDTSWVDLQQKSWDRNRISIILKAFAGFGTNRLFTIKSWPPWLDTDNDGKLDDGKEEAFADFCAEGVKIINLENKGQFQWWEILNEQDLNRSYPNGDLTPLAKAVNLAAQKMKEVDPSIKVTGNAWAWAVHPQTIPFVKSTLKAHDFFSWHTYATMVEGASFEMMVTNVITKYTEALARVKRTEIIQNLPLWLDEWNMFGNWKHDVETKLQSSPKAACFDLAVYKVVAESGIDVNLCAWEADGTYYGKGRGATGELRDAGMLMGLMNRYFVGEIIETKIDNTDAMISFGVKSSRTNISIAISNPSEKGKEIVISPLTSFESRNAKMYIVGEGRKTACDLTVPPIIISLTSKILVPKKSVIILLAQIKGE